MENKEMTAEQAIQWCEQLTDNVVKSKTDGGKFALALQAMSKCVKALKKQVPTEPLECYINVETDAKTLCCPSCRYSDGVDLEDWQDIKYNYCPICGQALDRSGE